jgi:hypothetical protein
MRTWFVGRKTCVPFLRSYILGSPGDWRMLATSANGQPAVAAYTRDQDGNYQPYGICVLTVTSAGIRPGDPHPGADGATSMPFGRLLDQQRVVSDSFSDLSGSTWV